MTIDKEFVARQEERIHELKSNRLHTPVDVVQYYLPNLSKSDADALLWEHTCFPFCSILEWEGQVKKIAEEAQDHVGR